MILSLSCSARGAERRGHDPIQIFLFIAPGERGPWLTSQSRPLLGLAAARSRQPDCLRPAAGRPRAGQEGGRRSARPAGRANGAVRARDLGVVLAAAAPPGTCRRRVPVVSDHSWWNSNKLDVGRSDCGRSAHWRKINRHWDERQRDLNVREVRLAARVGKNVRHNHNVRLQSSR